MSEMLAEEGDFQKVGEDGNIVFPEGTNPEQAKIRQQRDEAVKEYRRTGDRGVMVAAGLFAERKQVEPNVEKALDILQKLVERV